jgi:hypothetical protein
MELVICEVNRVVCMFMCPAVVCVCNTSQYSISQGIYTVGGVSIAWFNNQA